MEPIGFTDETISYRIFSIVYLCKRWFGFVSCLIKVLSLTLK